jgi:aspartyl-tRNA(Asn)/glutamyl-tRNA(Gln) amidotransferase subunit A
MSDLADLTLREVSARIRHRQVSSLEVTAAVLNRINRLQPLLNAYIQVDDEGALAAARRADEALARGDVSGPIHGVPLAHKDLFYRAGEPATAATPLRAQWRAPATATVLRRLDAAGAITVGRLNMAEFAYDPTGANRFTGFARNPWHRDYVSGGSSSGSGVAVAAGLCFGSLGTDTGGSIRLPASICGVVGVKPTYGRVSLLGCMPLSFSLDCIGPLARNVRDAARLLAVIAGHDPGDPTSIATPVGDYEAACERDPRGLRIGVPENYYFEHVSRDCAAAFHGALDRLRHLGCMVQHVPISNMTPAVAAANIVLGAESAALHRPIFSKHPDQYTDAVRTRLENGVGYSAVDYIDALRYRATALSRFLDAMAPVDVLAVPSFGLSPPTIADVEAQSASQVSHSVSLLTYWTRPANFLGVPAISVPIGFDRAGLPLGFQVIAKPFDEATAMRAASAVESCFEAEIKPWTESTAHGQSRAPGAPQE